MEFIIIIILCERKMFKAKTQVDIKIGVFHQ